MAHNYAAENSLIPRNIGKMNRHQLNFFTKNFTFLYIFENQTLIDMFFWHALDLLQYTSALPLDETWVSLWCPPGSNIYYFTYLWLFWLNSNSIPLSRLTEDSLHALSFHCNNWERISRKSKFRTASFGWIIERNFTQIFVLTILRVRGGGVKLWRTRFTLQKSFCKPHTWGIVGRKVLRTLKALRSIPVYPVWEESYEWVGSKLTSQTWSCLLSSFSD